MAEKEKTEPEVGFEDMPENPVEMAALVFLHREVSKTSRVVLTKEDFEAFEAARVHGFGVVISTNENEDIILTEVKSRSDA